MNIAVIFTGGTIASKTEGKCISLGSAPYDLLEGDYDDIKFITYEPYSILSEGITFSHLRLLIDSISAVPSDVDGIIVTHGTDSLVYTACALGYIFGRCNVPIFLVSSGKPLSDPDSNGRQNFAKAVQLIREHYKSGVYVVWHSDGKDSVHPATRLLRQPPYSAELYSLGDEIPDPGVCVEPVGFDDPTGKVIYLKALPFMYYPELTADISAVLIECYHSGTLCTDNRFADFVKKASSLGIPVFTAGTGGREADYESVEKYKALGVHMLPEASPDAMYIKLCLAAATRSDIIKFMFTPLGGDFV